MGCLIFMEGRLYGYYLKGFLGYNESIFNYIHRFTTKQEENNHIKHILGSYFINLFSYTFSKLNNGNIIGLGAF